MRKAYPSDLTDDQWALIEPHIPVFDLGRPRVVDMREVLNTILYLNRDWQPEWNGQLTLTDTKDVIHVEPRWGGGLSSATGASLLAVGSLRPLTEMPKEL